MSVFCADTNTSRVCPCAFHGKSQLIFVQREIFKHPPDMAKRIKGSGESSAIVPSTNNTDEMLPPVEVSDLNLFLFYVVKCK